MPEPGIDPTMPPIPPPFEEEVLEFNPPGPIPAVREPCPEWPEPKLPTYPEVMDNLQNVLGETGARGRRLQFSENLSREYEKVYRDLQKEWAAIDKNADFLQQFEQLRTGNAALAKMLNSLPIHPSAIHKETKEVFVKEFFRPLPGADIKPNIKPWFPDPPGEALPGQAGKKKRGLFGRGGGGGPGGAAGPAAGGPGPPGPALGPDGKPLPEPVSGASGKVKITPSGDWTTDVIKLCRMRPADCGCFVVKQPDSTE